MAVEREASRTIDAEREPSFTLDDVAALDRQFLPAANLAAIERKSSVWNDWFSADNA